MEEKTSKPKPLGKGKPYGYDFQKKVEIPIITSEKDVHNVEHMEGAELIVFMAGNQFMVIDELIETFSTEYDIPEEKIFYQTLPPRIMLKQILTGKALLDDREITGKADVYSSVSEESMFFLKEKGYISDYFAYLHNRIVMVVPKGNPAGVHSVGDLADEDVRISQPNPANEDIAFHIINMYREIGGDEFVSRIMEEKVEQGTTIITTVHHRETPMRIQRGEVDVGLVWATEALNASDILEVVEPGEGIDQRDKINYYIARLKDCNNPENAEKFLDFIKSGKAQSLFAKYGFVPHFKVD